MPYKYKEDQKKFNQRADVKGRKNKARREKYTNDPEYRENVLNILRKRNMLGYAEKWRKNNSGKCRKAVKIYRENNKEKIKKHRGKYVKENREKINISKRKWYKNNADKIGDRNKNRYRTDSKYNLNMRMSGAIRASLRRNKSGYHWELLVGYSVNSLIKRLKKTIPVGYSWQDCLNGSLHIDHIIPIDAFNFIKPENPDFKKCWALNNLQLLPAKENIIKHNKLTEPFQPTLKLIIEV